MRVLEVLLISLFCLFISIVGGAATGIIILEMRFSDTVTVSECNTMCMEALENVFKDIPSATEQSIRISAPEQTAKR